MALITIAGQTWMLERILADPVSMHLFVKDLELNEDVSDADFVEIQGGGYRPREIGPSEWTIEQGVAAAEARIFQVSNPPWDVFGYFMKSGDETIWAERFPDGPRFFRGPRDVIEVEPRISFRMRRIM